MKKISALLVLLMICLCGCMNTSLTNDEPHDSDIAMSDANLQPSNSMVDVDQSKIIKVDDPGCLPVSTESIHDILSGAERFSYQRITNLPGGGAIADVYFELDKPDGKDSEGIASISYQILADNKTQIISYNFKKSAINGVNNNAIRWGANVLLHIFGAELTDEIWADIAIIANKSETEDPWGTDYEGYADEVSGIRMIYGNLGKNVQIDIRPYYTGLSYTNNTPHDDGTEV